MTFTEIVTEICDRLNLTSTTATTRVGRLVNMLYRDVTASIGLGTTRRTEVQANATISSQFVTFSAVEKVISVIDKSSGQNRYLDEVTIDELDRLPVITGDTPTKYAIYRTNADTVQIKTNALAQTAYTLYAPGYVTSSTLSGSQEPAFPESFHDLLVSGVLADEYAKLEKESLSAREFKKYEDRLGDLRIFLATSPQQDIYPGKLAGGTTGAGSVGGSVSSGGGTPGTTSYTQTGLVTFDRTGQVPGSRAPFAVASGSEVVPNLIAETAATAVTATDADTLDGEHGSYYRNADNLNTGTIPNGRFPATLPAASGANLTSVNAATLGGSSLSQVLQAIYPVGIVVTLGVSTSPATLFGFGTWAAIAGRVIVGLDSGQTEFDTLDETGGSKTHTLSSAEMPSHTHSVTDPGHSHTQRVKGGGGAETDVSRATDRTGAEANGTSTTASATTGISIGSTGSGGAHNNLQPYIVKYVWQRTA